MKGQDSVEARLIGARLVTLADVEATHVRFVTGAV